MLLTKELIDEKKFFPADFIAEGVDQTRGWFFTLHAIGTMVFDEVAYKNVMSNGLVLDKNGQKMSKRLGNAVDPFSTLAEYGPDATRWYMITNAQPWDNLKFDLEGITEVQRKFFRALHNTYAFFALYANVDGFEYAEADMSADERPEIDRWVLSKLNSLVKEVDAAYAAFEPTKAGRLIQDFVVNDLSNWHIRLSRKRFWRGEYGADKISAYQTVYTCLKTVAQLAAPIAPFYADQLFNDLNAVTGEYNVDSIHLTDFPTVNAGLIDVDLEERMSLAQQISSMVLSLRKRENIRVRQPLQKIMLPVLSEKFERQVKAVESLILSEVNIKEIEYLTDASGVLVKRIKPNFKALGPKYGKIMKGIAAEIQKMDQEAIAQLEAEGKYNLTINEEVVEIEVSDTEISTDDIPGWLVLSENGLTVALDITISEELYLEGLARELVNRIQTARKDLNLEVTDRVSITISEQSELKACVEKNFDYICSETLTDNLEFGEVNESTAIVLELDEKVQSSMNLVKS